MSDLQGGIVVELIIVLLNVLVIAPENNVPVSIGILSPNHHAEKEA